MAEPTPYYIVDAFTDHPFSGNPAAVCLLESSKSEDWLKLVAREMNLSETAFLARSGDVFDLRWFSPQVEVDLCGHATLASAHVLWTQGFVPPGTEIRFSTRSGILTANQKGTEIELDFPLIPETESDPPARLLEGLGVSAKYVGKSVFDYLVEVESETVVRRLAPNFRLLAGVAARGIIVTSRSDDPNFDFVSRFFAPATGIDEDPATGSAHCCLGDFWRKRMGKGEFRGYQASKRGGIIRVRVTDKRAYLGGTAVIIAKGQLLPTK